MSERLVVVGGDAAGMAAAAQARRRRDVDTLEILAFERGRFTSYSACGIPYWVAGVVPDRDMLIARSPAEHRARGVDVRMRHEVIGIDPAAGTVQVVDLDAGSEAAVGFDHLMLATGAVPVRPDLPGIDAEGIHGIQTLGDAERLRDDLARHRPDRAVIVGGGYIGLEVAGALLARGLDVTVVHVHAHPIASLDADMGTLVAGALRDAGADLRACHRVEGFDVDPGGRVTAVHTDTGEPIPAGLVVLGLGVQPDVELARRAGIEIGPAGGVAVDRRCRTSNDAVWSGGDCSEKFHRVRQEPVAIALGSHRQQAGPCRGHQPRRRLRDVPRGRGHRRHQGVRRGGRPHGVDRGGGGGGRVPDGERDRDLNHQGRLLPRSVVVDGQGRGRAPFRTTAGRPDRG